ncbi:c-type cytochrome [Paracoccus saliphilus]|uniref:Cytochrome c n=1 Tax=Paracoccus saliphilus TaxID=405559 RepID=A0AA45W393_9RHOB|nr:cytochrome c [Paracoccus saliphilus]WCR02402.1 cytochrome c [Paracoccus saliphilus]SIS75256.1 Cytochrome c, mono-and diheme variants [Paracoccus saliphilus]
MRPGLVAAAAAATTLFAVAAAAFVQAEDSASDAEDLTFLGASVTSEDIALGKQLYTENCASCHGADLEGQPDWKRRLPTGRMPAPPHDETGHTWHHSDQDLFTMTKQGVAALVPDYDSDMPGFEDMLTDDEIKAVLAFIKSTWPERQRAFQGKLNGEGGT